jgi:hypothetical protein
MADLAAIYGLAFPMMLRYEREVLGRPERMPGLPSSFSGNCNIYVSFGKPYESAKSSDLRRLPKQGPTTSAIDTT